MTGRTSDQLDVLSRAHAAPAERTLVDILRDSAARYPDASALDDGTVSLSYREVLAHAVRVAAVLAAAGVRRGDRVGIRMQSGRRQLYIAILGVLVAGAAYVPVDADDPEERATLVFGEADVVGILEGDGVFVPRADGRGDMVVDGPGTMVAADERPTVDTAALTVVAPPRPTDDAWIIFTSGSTGVPKGVAVSHRSAAAFVDAEARIFLADEPIGPDDRVLAGLSVAFDASCEEMWLAWGHGACLVPAPRSLVRSGVDLGPWLVARGVTVVSTVPTLAALWPAESLENVRLLIFGGEACPPELAERLAVDGREVWNTYGPTEATVVACAAPLGGAGPVRIGLPLDGWDLAVVDAAGERVAEGEVGELVIGGVGLGRYLDAAKDAEKYAPAPTLGWNRAYRSGDLVRFEAAGLVFQGRVDDQVKVGGRRIELGEIEASLQALPGVAGAAAAVRSSSSGSPVLVGYLAVPDRSAFDRPAAIAALRAELPAALVPVLALVDELPTRTSGKVDKAALPWPLPVEETSEDAVPEGMRLLAQDWTAVLGVPVPSAEANFFDLGGGSLAAAQLVTRVRARDPEFTVADVYALPRLVAMAAALDERDDEDRGRGRPTDFHRVEPTPRAMGVFQTIASVPIASLAAARWLASLLAVAWVLGLFGLAGPLPRPDGWVVALLVLLFVTPLGRMLLTALAARVLLRGLRPGDYPRGGSVHRRIWAVESIAHALGGVGLSGAPFVVAYGRLLGARIASEVTLHSLPPLTGMLTIGEGASVEPEVDLSGYWIDGDILRVGEVRIGAGSVIGARSALLPGTRIGRDAQIEPASAVFGRVRAGQRWAGSPAVRVGRARRWWPDAPPPRGRGWWWVYAASSSVLALLPAVALVCGAAVLVPAIGGADTIGEAGLRALLLVVPATLVAGLVLAAEVVLVTRALAIGLTEGVFPVRSRQGWQVWATERLLDLSRTILFPLYSSLFTPVWLRLLGAEVGRDVEASTVLLIPSMTTIRDGAFLADDTLVASYELGGGYVSIGRAEIGRRSFLGNSGMAAGGRRIPRDSLVAVLSVAPRKSKAGSSWLGSPTVRLRRTPAVVDDALTFSPPGRLRVARAAWELARVVPVVVSVAIGLLLLWALAMGVEVVGLVPTLAVGGVVLILVGAVAAGLTSLAKWTLIGRIRAGEHPLWSSFIWRSELADTFTEMVAAPWFANGAAGTPALVVWLRSLGARIGRGVWCESYWLPEADLVSLGDGSTVNRGCVVQTHLFHDRIMSMDHVTLGAGATLGPHSVALPAARVGDHATIGPSSLVMRGETVPDGGRWSGNPIGPWRDVVVGDYHVSAASR
ncbi:Pls/PosA family non-ribosomal peptide synthetase [Labedella endophytica]|uniref:Pls/PosA family non-ribosomal peptide synthetase n=1 Tax=Labedella endophytica TaxID=1523160 RepID=UPI001FB668CA|nr:Pls/PosA family non-ribosomal peptide synthetase [Labedella endophytica]